MSRNFELLQNLGQEQLLTGIAPAVSIPACEPLPVNEPKLKLEPVEQEQLTKLVQRVFLLPGGEAPRVVLFTATESGNGSSWIAARVAEILAAQVSGTVCLIDANLKNPSLHCEFELENNVGLADFLRGSAPINDFAHSFARSKLRIVCSGSGHERSLAQLGSERIRQKLAELREEANYILLDCPAVGVSPDVMVLGAAADGVVLVLKANCSRRETARQTIENFQQANVPILGAVLNQRTFPVPEAIYRKL